MPDSFVILLDQNVPRTIAPWLRNLKPTWIVHHTSDVSLSGKVDEEIYSWAQQHRALIITFDEDFADQRSFPLSEHCGIIRLRVWPTTIEETQHALDRLLSQVSDQDLFGALVIVDRNRIRVRPKERGEPA